MSGPVPHVPGDDGAAAGEPSGAAPTGASHLTPGSEDLVQRLYEVLARPGALRTAAAVEDRLHGFAAVVADATGAQSCEVRLGAGGHGLPVVLGEDPVGVLVIDRRRRPLDRMRRRVGVREAADALAVPLGALAARLRAEQEAVALERSSQALWAARRAAVEVQDDERRTLERNLHDGVQHHLIALRVELSLLGLHLTQGDTGQALARVEAIQRLVATAGSALEQTAAGALPEVLVRGGLAPAVEAELRDAHGVHVNADDRFRRRRYPLFVEVAAYFGCLEAVNNAVKHAPGSPVAVTLDDVPAGFTWTVRDAGPGFDPAALTPASSVRLLRDRIAAAGGDLTITSAPEQGTTVHAVMRV